MSPTRWKKWEWFPLDAVSLIPSTIQKFLQDLLTQQFDVLHPLFSFQRRNLSLSILQLMAACFPPPTECSLDNNAARDVAGCDAAPPPVFVFSSAVSEPQGACLLGGLRDPYETNRVMCLDLLLELPTDKFGLTVSSWKPSCYPQSTKQCSPQESTERIVV